ncbi:hypothetical protein GpartN1_g5536.t1 [Galdieria partita]|uniref:Uncharacterized protein n=1 Tax=Galdieria partita TaxID=83374 RepID=A0A9C7Q0D5_9RHOD|nr:hypothetical protein GpartN1_g5536.t1 [Galdieria partita]
MNIPTSAFVLSSSNSFKLWKTPDAHKHKCSPSCIPVFSGRFHGCRVERILLGCPPTKRRKFLNCNMKTTESGDKSSFYKRPSKALSYGGGFFVPGLEGPLLERVIGGILLFAFFLNIFTTREWDLHFRISLLIGFLAILLWLYLQFRHAAYDSIVESKLTGTASTRTRRKVIDTSFSSSIEAELNCLFDVLENFYRVEYLAIYREAEPFTVVPVSVTVGILVKDIAELLYKNVNKALHFSTSPPWQPELLCFLPNGFETGDIGFWLYPFFCPSLDRHFTFVVCYEGTQRFSSENGKWLIEWVKNRLIPYLDSSQSPGIR